MKKILICVVLMVIAFGVGYGLGYWKLREAEKNWEAARAEMQSRIGTLEKELKQAKAREALWETPSALAQVSAHLAEKNFGLAGQKLEQIKKNYLEAQPVLSEEWKKEFAFLVPALEETKKEAENLSPEAKKKVDEMRARVEQALRGPKG